MYEIILSNFYISGNILLTDHEFVILGVLRPRLNVDVDSKVAVRETYDLSDPKSVGVIPTNEEICKFARKWPKPKPAKIGQNFAFSMVKNTPA